MQRNWSWQLKPLTERSPPNRSMQRRSVCSGRCSINWAKTILPSYMARPSSRLREKPNFATRAPRVQVDDSWQNRITARKSIASAIAPITDSGHYWDKPRYDNATERGPGNPGRSRVNQVAILYPVFVQVLLVVVVGMSMAAARARAIKT